jgi:outer membrane protein
MKFLTILNTLFLTGILGFLIYTGKSKAKLAYVNNGELLSSFKLTKELNDKVKSLEQNRKFVLDSMLNDFRAAEAKKVDKSELEKLQNLYLMKRNAFSKEVENLKQSANQKIANQLNEYVAQFSKDREYEVVLGANGDGNIWYSAESANVTKELIVYVNEKYEAKPQK